MITVKDVVIAFISLVSRMIRSLLQLHNTSSILVWMIVLL